jgi:hypothetical protein
VVAQIDEQQPAMVADAVHQPEMRTEAPTSVFLNWAQVWRGNGA